MQVRPIRHFGRREREGGASFAAPHGGGEEALEPSELDIVHGRGVCPQAVGVPHGQRQGGELADFGEEVSEGAGIHRRGECASAVNGEAVR